MEEEFVEISPTYKGNIWSTPQQRTDWRIYLTELNDDPKNHIEAIDLIRQAGEADSIEILLTSPGGFCDIADMYVAAIKDSNAQIITRAVGQCASAATTIFLAGHERICEDGCHFMFHNVQMGGLEGDAANFFSRAKFYERLYKEKSYDSMAEVLTPKEMGELFERAGEVYLTAEEMRERLATAERKAEALDKFRSGELPAPPDTGDVSEDWPVISGPPGDFVNFPWPTKEVAAAEVFGHEDDFDIILDDGYRKTFRLSTLCPKDFDEYNRHEIIEIGKHFGHCLLGLTRDEAVRLLILELKTGGGED